MMSDETKLTLTGMDAALILKKEDGTIELLLPKQNGRDNVYSTTLVISAFVSRRLSKNG